MVMLFQSYIHGDAIPELYTWRWHSRAIYMVMLFQSYIHGDAIPELYTW